MRVACKICRNNSNVLLEDVDLCLYRCSGCSHVFKILPEQKQEQYNGEYLYVKHKNWIANPDYKLFEFINNQITQRLGNRKLELLDVGCGSGDFLRYLKAKRDNSELYGIDLIPNQHPAINFIEGDLLKETINKKFNVVTALHVIEHLEQPQLLMDKIRGMLASEGLLFVTTDDDRSLIYKIARMFKKIGLPAAYNQLYSTHHLHCFSRKSLNALTKNSDFSIVYFWSHNFPLKALDFPKTNLIMRKIYSFAVRVIFFISNIIKRNILQTVICEEGSGLEKRSL